MSSTVSSSRAFARAKGALDSAESKGFECVAAIFPDDATLDAIRAPSEAAATVDEDAVEGQYEDEDEEKCLRDSSAEFFREAMLVHPKVSSWGANGLERPDRRRRDILLDARAGIQSRMNAACSTLLIVANALRLLAYEPRRGTR